MTMTTAEATRFSLETCYQARAACSRGSGDGHCVAPRGAVAVVVWRQWGKGAVINRSSSRASRASLLNKLIWKMAPVAISIDRPPPHRVGGRGSICQLL
jgi:hypothetical protein